MFGKRKKQNSNKAALDISVGNELMFYGQICEITNVKSTKGTTFVRLSFNVVDGRKTGTDGWYDLVKSQKDPQICNNTTDHSASKEESIMSKMNAF